MPPRGGVGAFLLRRAANKSIRQKHATGPMHHKRKFFNMPDSYHQMHRRVSARQTGAPAAQREHDWFRHLPGDTRRRPEEDFTFPNDVGGDRADKAMYAWRKRGRLQVFQMGGKTEVFVCFRCGYPVKSKLQVIKDDNWDWRMCYPCYVTSIGKGTEHDE